MSTKKTTKKSITAKRKTISSAKPIAKRNIVKKTTKKSVSKKAVKPKKQTTKSSVITKTKAKTK